MSATATPSALPRRLRVSILAADVSRLAALRRMILEVGHEFVESPDAADVVLCDGDCPTIETRPCVTLGGIDASQAAVLARDADVHQIDAALCAVAAGLIVRSPEAGESGFGAMNEGDIQTLLTPREIEVLSAIGEGLTNKLVARRLNISLHTVKFHVESLFKKLAVRTRTEAVAKAIELRRSRTSHF